jgi:hypothetical protein
VWRERCPDLRLRDPSGRTALMTWFDKFEVASGNGARCYRDLIWVAHLLAAFAVFSAIAGSFQQDREIWSVLEIVFLFGIVVAVVHGRLGLHHRWMACRLGAEKLRASILCVSLFATPALLNRRYRPASGTGASRYAATTADALATRAVRDHGLSALPSGFTWRDAADWVLTVAEDQLKYHEVNHRKMEEIEDAIKVVTVVLFVLIVGVVLAHLVHYPISGALLATAGGPALLGALHGAATQLGIGHRARASEGCAAELGRAIKAFKASQETTKADPDQWNTVRTLAVATANSMSQEVEGWHSTLVREPMFLA